MDPKFEGEVDVKGAVDMVDCGEERDTSTVISDGWTI